MIQGIPNETNLGCLEAVHLDRLLDQVFLLPEERSQLGVLLDHLGLDFVESEVGEVANAAGVVDHVKAFAAEDVEAAGQEELGLVVRLAAVAEHPRSIHDIRQERRFG